MSVALDHEVREDGGATVISLRGEIDLDSSPAARRVLLDCVGAKCPVIVDLAGVAYMDSSGVASLVEAYQQARKHSCFFALAAPAPSVLRVLELARLDRVFQLFESVQEGLRAAR